MQKPVGEELATKSPFKHRLWAWLRARKVGLWQLIVAPVLVLVLAALALRALEGAKPQGGADQARPKDVAEQVGDMEVWERPPALIPSAEVAWDSAKAESTQLHGQPLVAVPEDLADRGAAYAGEDLYVVGEVVEDLSVFVVKFAGGTRGISSEVLATDTSGADVYLGINSGTPIRQRLSGDIVVAIGRIVAIGTTSTPNGKRSRAAYLLVTGGGLGRAAPVFVSSLQRLHGFPRAVQEAARRVVGHAAVICRIPRPALR